MTEELVKANLQVMCFDHDWTSLDDPLGVATVDIGGEYYAGVEREYVAELDTQGVVWGPKAIDVNETVPIDFEGGSMVDGASYRLVVTATNAAGMAATASAEFTGDSGAQTSYGPSSSETGSRRSSSSSLSSFMNGSSSTQK